jgi:hypothetical protein
MTTPADYTVRRQPDSKSYGIWLGADLVEGGFSTKQAAEDYRDAEYASEAR